MRNDPAKGLGLIRIGVIGLGVMGGSLARALSGIPDREFTLLGYSPDPAERDQAATAGAVDRVAESAEALVGDADLLVYATPMDVTLDLIPAHGPLWKPHAVLTDVTSLQVPTARAAAEAGAGPRWVGSHPMAGSERAGFGASTRDLYRNARVWICPGSGDPGRGAAEQVRTLWKTVGAVPEAVAAEDHDRLMIRASHLPQVLSNALAAVLRGQGVTASDLGPGGRDMTRLAASSPDMWLPLLRQSGPELAGLLREVGLTLESIAGDLDDAGSSDSGRTALEGLAELMETTWTWRQFP
jgi:prephenate dehydrogenase